jgi:hypothetical protein
MDKVKELICTDYKLQILVLTFWALVNPVLYRVFRGGEIV